MIYKDIDKRVIQVLEAINTFKDDLQALKRIIKLYIENIFLEGGIVGIESLKDKL